MAPLSLLRRGWNFLRALALQVRGRRRMSAGDAEGAARAFERAVTLAPGAYAPLLLLGRAHVLRRDLARARRAFALAREAAPARFARDQRRVGLADGVAMAMLLGAPGELGRASPSAEATTAVRAPRTAPSALPFGDCQDLDEYARFGAMPPITPGEIASTDWDALMEDLQDG